MSMNTNEDSEYRRQIDSEDEDLLPIGKHRNAPGSSNTGSRDQSARQAGATGCFIFAQDDSLERRCLRNNGGARHMSQATLSRPGMMRRMVGALNLCSES